MGTILVDMQHPLQDPIPITIGCIILFIAGYWLGNLKTKKLIRKLAKMEKKIMDLNTELLYGPSAKLSREKSHSTR